MKLCVGAVSRRVVQEAAKLQVPQIVASRRQVDEHGGYTGITPWELVEMVSELSDNETEVVRDHGGPHQAGRHEHEREWLDAFDIDCDAGFDALHVDVSKLPRDRQVEELHRLLDRYASRIDIEIGGERDEQPWLDTLVAATLDHGVTPSYAVVDIGGHAHADRQCGFIAEREWALEVTTELNGQGIASKAHNMDWAGKRLRYVGALDAYNIAPEFAQVELDALMYVMPANVTLTLLEYAALTECEAAERWFDHGEGTAIERARCKLRYLMNHKVISTIIESNLDDAADEFVRGAIRDSLQRG